MKTLDEVIKALEICTSDRGGCEECPYDPDCKPDRKWDDALHYLKEYRMQLDDIVAKRKKLESEMNRYQEAVKNCEEAENKYRQLAQNSGELGNTSQITCPKCHSEFVILPESNPALTWDELRTMKGKPVWIEGEHGCIWDQKSWVLIRLYKENDDLIICVGTDNGHYEFTIDKEDYGTDWQAYRKERE